MTYNDSINSRFPPGVAGWSQWCNSVGQDGYPSPLTEVRLFDPFNDVVFQHVIILNYFSELNQCCYLLYCLFVRFLKGMRGGSGGGRACEQINSPFMR